MTTLSGNGKRQSRPAFEERMRQQKFSGEYQQLVSRGYAN